MQNNSTTARTNYVLFYARIRELNYSIKEVALLAGINPKTLYKKLEKHRSFTDKEIAGLRIALQLTLEETCQVFICGDDPGCQAI